MFTDWLVQTWETVKDWGLNEISKPSSQQKIGDTIEDLIRGALLFASEGASVALEPIVDQISPAVQRAIGQSLRK